MEILGTDSVYDFSGVKAFTGVVPNDSSDRFHYGPRVVPDHQPALSVATIVRRIMHVHGV